MVEENSGRIEADDQRRQDLYARTRTELLARQFSNSEAYDKAILTLSTGFLALSLTFIKDILPYGSLTHFWLLYSSWAVFSAAIISTVASFRISNSAIETQLERARLYYLERDDAAFAKSHSSRLVDVFNWVSGIAFLGGVVLTVALVTINFSKVQTMTDARQTDRPSQEVAIEPLTKGQPVPQMQQVPQTQPTTSQPAPSTPAPQPSDSTPSGTQK